MAPSASSFASPFCSVHPPCRYGPRSKSEPLVYDTVGNLLQRTDFNGTVTSYGYDDVGNLSHFHTPNGVTHAYAYNALNRLTSLDVSHGLQPLASYAYTQQRTGHRTSAEESFQSGTGVSPVNRSARYNYDSLYRLTNETITASTGPAGSVAYGFDNVGNRLTRTSGLPGVSSQSFTYDLNDRLNSDQYDNNGNTVVGRMSSSATDAEAPPQTVTDTYDSENRLIARSGPINNQPSTINIVYDGDGNKVRETINGQTISYLIDTLNPTGYAQVVEELQNGTVVRTYTYGHDLLVQDQRTDTNTWTATWYGYDGHGSVRLLTDGAGQITDRYDYDAFGVLLHGEGTTYNRYRYCGEQFDEGLGLYYLRARYMNAANGRFWSMDSYEGTGEDPASLHKYQYANAAPIMSRDPSGLATLAEVESTLATVASVVEQVVTIGIRAYRIYSLAQDVLNFFYGVSEIVSQLSSLEEGLSSTELADMFWDAAWEVLIEDTPEMLADDFLGPDFDYSQIMAAQGPKLGKWGKKHGGDRHWRWIQKIADKMKAKGFRNIRVNRRQPGQLNLPDIQSVTPNGKRRWYVEVDSRAISNRRHATVIMKGDPKGEFRGLILGKNTSDKSLEKIVESWFIK